MLKMPISMSEIEVAENLRPRVARQLGLPLEWDVAIDALPPPRLSTPSGWLALACRLYRRVRPKRIGDRCAFEPSCSRYAEVSFRASGVWRGLRQTVLQLRRCNARHGGLDLPAAFAVIPHNQRKSFMQYRVESIGASFSDKAIQALGDRLSAESERGWELHSVFSVQKTGCFGVSQGATYLAVYRRSQN